MSYAPGSVNPGSDPGWRPAVRLFGRGPRPTDGLLVLRMLFVALVKAALLIGVVLAFLGLPLGEPEAVPLAGVIALGLAGIAAATWTARRPLTGTDEAAVAGAYRTSFFLGFALNEMPLLAAFVISFLLEEMWAYFLALPLYLVGMWRIAPSRGNLERRQEDLHRQGSPVSLSAALQTAPVVKQRGGRPT